MAADFAGRRVLVAGAGVTGRPTASTLAGLGAVVTVTDANAERLDELADIPDVTLAPGLRQPPAGTDLVVTSPGWRPSAPLLVSARDAGVPVYGDIELAWRLSAGLPHPPAWLAVTGTNGKTTTVGMLESILHAAGVSAVACGNVGLPVLDALAGGHAALAVELSSFQLHWSDSLAPAASVVLNVAEDHIDWHGTLDAYAADKGKIYTGARAALYNADDAWSVRLAEHNPMRVSFTLGEPVRGQWGVADGWLVDADGTALLPETEVRPEGRHNVANALAAAALARIYGVPGDAVADGLRAFAPGAHRSVLVAERDDVRWVNDSKATNPHAAAGSLLGDTGEGKVVWIAGGLLKGASVDELVRQVAGRLRGCVLIGVDAAPIEAALARHAPDVPSKRVPPGDDEVMIAAVRSAQAMARPGDTVLLAPAAASMDQFTDYAQRGRAFADAVAELLAAAPR